MSYCSVFIAIKTAGVIVVDEGTLVPMSGYLLALVSSYSKSRSFWRFLGQVRPCSDSGFSGG